MFLKVKNYSLSFSLSKIEMVDECDKQLNLENFVFDEENLEQKSWKFFGRMCNRSLVNLM